MSISNEHLKNTSFRLSTISELSTNVRSFYYKTLNGYTFKNWVDQNGDVYNDGDTIQSNTDLDLTANWERTSGYALSNCILNFNYWLTPKYKNSYTSIYGQSIFTKAYMYDSKDFYYMNTGYWSVPYGIIVYCSDHNLLSGNLYNWINISEDVYADKCEVSALLMSIPPCDGVLTVGPFNLKHYFEMDIYSILSGSSGAYYTKDKMRLGVRGEVYDNSDISAFSDSTDWNNKILYDGSFRNLTSMKYMIDPIFLNDNILTVSVTPNDGYKLNTIKLTDDPNGSFDNAPETNTIQLRKPSKDLAIQLRGLVVLEPTSDEAIEEYNTVINSLTSKSNT